MLRSLFAATLAAAALFGATAAQAETHWSIGINLPPAGVVVSNGPRYYVQEPAPVYYAPAPVVRYAPAPRYVQRDIYYAPAPRVVYETSYRDRRWDGRRDHWESRRENERHHHHGGRWDSDRDNYGPHRGR
jgi:hypothetical protein